MKKEHLPFILITVCLILIILDLIFISDEMDLAFWLRMVANSSIILGMLFRIRESRMKDQKKSE
ncbi:hypothetical protein [Robertkochia sediminum]|uniref:hypothetical protein n=1 Tax=Robertkochia sediminum TaxID=2785326 RepID=UPI001934915D|nr:hypothetical protein [Robertkochia sediminum]MBL7471190.1 hypothetical protein [Robertkochia sediminum]